MVGLRGRAPPVRRGIPEMLDLGIHVIVARGGDHVHLRRGGAQVQRVERVVQRLAVRVEDEHLVPAAAVGG